MLHSLRNKKQLKLSGLVGTDFIVWSCLVNVAGRYQRHRNRKLSCINKTRRDRSMVVYINYTPPQLYCRHFTYWLSSKTKGYNSISTMKNRG
jgi:hypothetical protein